MSAALGMALPIILLKLFDQNSYGMYKQSFNIVLSIITVFPPGFCMTSYYFFPREPERAKSVAFNAWLVASLMGLVPFLVLFFRPDLISHYIKRPEAVAEAPWIGLVIFLWSSSLFIELAPLANRDVTFASKFIVIANAIKACCMLAGALITRSLHGILVAAAVFGIFQLGILMYYLHTRFPGFLTAFSMPVMKRQFAYFGKVMPAALMGELQTYMPPYFVGFRYSTLQTSIYSAGCFNLPVTQILLESVGSILVRKVNELDADGNRREIIRLTLSATRKLSMAFFPFYILMVVVSREFFLTVSRKEYLDAVPIFVLNLSLVPISIIMFDPIGRAFPDQQGKIMKIRALVALFMAIGLWYGTAHFGPISATAVVLGAAVLERTSLLIFWGRFLGATKADLFGFRDIGRVALAAIVAGGLTWLVRLSLLGLKPVLVLIACGCVFAPIYVALIFLLQVPSLDERRMVTSRIAWVTRAARLA